MRDSTESGFTLIELVVSVMIMTLMIAAVGNIFISNLNTVATSKARALALGLANYQIEYMRDLPYNSLATQHGTIYPPGNIPDSQTMTSDGYKFTVATIINYVHDPYDTNGVYPFDYKQAEVKVTLAVTGQTLAELVTTMSPKATQTPTNTGILSISVINANGQPLPNAAVTIINTTLTPNVNISTTTNNQGVVVIPDLPPEANNTYKVTATATGYSTDQTLPPPGGSQKAVELNPNIIAAKITSVTMSIDLLSTLNVTVDDTSGNPISNMAIKISGAKEIYTNPIVYKYSQTSTTSSTGTISLPSMEWDSYSFVPPNGYEVVTSNPYSPVALAPNGTQNVTLVVTNTSGWPAISSVAPTSEATGNSSVSLSITGSNLPSTSTVNLEMSGQSNITGTSCSSTGSNPSEVLTCKVDLTSAAVGSWDIDVTNSKGTADQTGGFNVIN